MPQANRDAASRRVRASAQSWWAFGLRVHMYDCCRDGSASMKLGPGNSGKLGNGIVPTAKVLESKWAQALPTRPQPRWRRRMGAEWMQNHAWFQHRCRSIPVTTRDRGRVARHCSKAARPLNPSNTPYVYFDGRLGFLSTLVKASIQRLDGWGGTRRASAPGPTPDQLVQITPQTVLCLGAAVVPLVVLLVSVDEFLKLSSSLLAPLQRNFSNSQSQSPSGKGNFGAAEDPVDRVSRRNAVICYEESGGIMVDTFPRGQTNMAIQGAHMNSPDGSIRGLDCAACSCLRPPPHKPTRQGLTRMARARVLLALGPGQYHQGATALDKVQPGRDAELTAEQLLLFLCDGFPLRPDTLEIWGSNLSFLQLRRRRRFVGCIIVPHLIFLT
ncbi:uncharacterized protein CLUP02_07723 [Colletotrichum lupini]|uniref:Uncharacterized protein n=1 Tax=Colletotrichum lupini TaxID=145971 RepID=A0A9Q8WGC1_9PEZI|nr:uncharacterized protein CLUP02_07723 [Colletotrichum lupini]UQC82236.1 hypothetical protein CLUP02_07723 [Colletotrichum lupini]